jgi:hypothetical protein
MLPCPYCGQLDCPANCDEINKLLRPKLLTIINTKGKLK